MTDTARITVDGPFDMHAVAADFHGLLRFEGAAAADPSAPTVVWGAVNEADLASSVKANALAPVAVLALREPDVTTAPPSPAPAAPWLRRARHNLIRYAGLAAAAVELYRIARRT